MSPKTPATHPGEDATRAADNGAQKPEKSAEALFRQAQQALQSRALAAADPADVALPPSVLPTGHDEAGGDDDMPLMVGASGYMVRADTLDAARAALADPERVGDLVRQTYVAPDPYEEFPLERKQALAPLLAHGEQGFGLSRLPAEFHGMTGTEKLDYLLGLPEPAVVLQALPAEEFTFLLKDIGLSDASPLLALASPRQMQTLVDLDVWQGDEIDRRRFAHLLAVAVNANQETVDRFLASQEDALLCTFISGSARVYESAEEAEQQLPEDWESFISPDGTMVVGTPMGDPAVPPIRVILESVYRVDLMRGRRILRASRWELPISMEEDLYETRNKRNDDHGFPPKEKAREVYNFVSPAEAREQADRLLAGDHAEMGEALPFIPDELEARADLALHGLAGAPFLAKAAALCSEETHSRLQLAMVRLAYELQAARAERPSETDELPTWSRHALLTANMGLSWLARDDAERGAALLRLTPLRELFRVGHSLVVALHHRAIRLRRRLGGRVELAGPELGRLLAGLCRALPERPIPQVASAAQEFDAGRMADGEDEGAQKPQFRPFERREELAEAGALLAGLEATVGLLEGLSGDALPTVVARLSLEMVEGVDEELELTSLLATAIAWTVVDGSPRLTALAPSTARRFLREGFTGPVGARRVKPALRAALSRSLLANPELSDAEVAPLEGFVERTLARLDDELGGLDPAAELDARFAGTALILATENSTDPV